MELKIHIRMRMQTWSGWTIACMRKGSSKSCQFVHTHDMDNPLAESVFGLWGNQITEAQISRPCLLKTAQEPSMTLWKGRDASYTSIVSLYVGVQDLATRVPCRLMTSQSQGCCGCKRHGSLHKARSGLTRSIHTFNTYPSALLANSMILSRDLSPRCVNFFSPMMLKDNKQMLKESFLKTTPLFTTFACFCVVIIQ